MIDGGFLWVKLCWALAMARGALLRGISWFMLVEWANGYLIFGGCAGQYWIKVWEGKRALARGTYIFWRGANFLIPLSPLELLLCALQALLSYTSCWTRARGCKWVSPMNVKSRYNTQRIKSIRLLLICNTRGCKWVSPSGLLNFIRSRGAQDGWYTPRVLRLLSLLLS